MTRPLAFTVQASTDVQTAIEWYEAQRPGLGAEFLDVLGFVIAILPDFPLRGPLVFSNVRRLLLPRFPYAVYYRVQDDQIEIRGCLHQRRAPDSARGRA